MARPETPLPEDAPQPLLELAQGLRDLKAASQLSYQAMGERARLSPASLSRAASGRQVPTEEALFAFLKACAVPADEFDAWRERWRDATVASQLAPKPWSIDNQIAHLAMSGRLRELHSAAGSPTVRMISERSGIPRSTVHRVLTAHMGTRHRTPPSPDHTLGVASALLGFLRPSKYMRNGPFADVHNIVRHTHPVRRGAHRPPEGGVRRALATAQAKPPPTEAPAETVLLSFAERASVLEHRITSGELQADEEVVRLLADLRKIVGARPGSAIDSSPAAPGTPLREGGITA
ncbi:helix-turn-helix domain-containing protein [Streptomyces milbemycinicus]|uniref:Helix-turn-helix domain-containing protein n=1 Tax=Streptomyces milbemycinicus TaxID=476552 RepID=A0ABW8M2X8_9ACTN